MKKDWKITPANKELQSLFVNELNIHPVTAQLLINRGLEDSETAFSFLRPDINNIHDPFLMKDMDKAVVRIEAAINSGEKIVVYGDYDVDGTSGTSLLKLFLDEVGAHVDPYIPDRMAEGYGLNNGAIKNLFDAGTRLLVTSDCGASNNDEVAYANSLGIDVIITDHHETPEELPPAFAVLNPRRSDCEYPFKGLAGVGVAFKLVVALRGHLRDRGHFKGRDEPNLKRYLDILCVGTVADMVPLVDENRVLVKFGLQELKETRRHGLKALKSVAGLRDERLTTESISYQLAPRLNAAGRIGKAWKSLELLTTKDDTMAAQVAYELDQFNTERQRMERGMFNEAIGMLGEECADMGIVLHSDSWHPGVIGIVASRLASRFTRPTVLIGIDGDTGRGSARGVKGFDILKGLSNCSEFLERFGGHKAAAGFSISKERVEEFKEAFITHLNNTLTEGDLTPELELDAKINLDDIDSKLVSEIECLSPFGISNREPLLCAEDAHIVHTEVVGSKHLRLKVRHKGNAIKAIGFGLGEMHPLKGPGFDIAFRPYFDEWKGSRNLSLKIKDLKETVV